MKSLEEALLETAEAAVVRVILSDPDKGSLYKRINISQTKYHQAYLAEKLTQTQAFHEHIPAGGLFAFLMACFTDGLNQLTAWTEDGTEYAVKRTKNGSILTNKRKAAPPKLPEPSHNREKRYIIPEGASVPPLVDMGVFTKDGRVVSSMYGKYKQINRFLEILNDIYSENPPQSISVADFGCGKSYLTFLVYYYFNEILGIKTKMLGLDLKTDVVASCAEAAKRYGYDGLSFRQGDAAAFSGDFPADILISLHACDTATDHALFQAVKNGVQAIFAVPCCQHELHGQIQPGPFPLITRYGILKERASAIFTDAIRANLLTAAGYKTQLLEFIDMEHTPKNIMIRAVKSQMPQKKRQEALNEVIATVKAFSLSPTLLRLFEENDIIPDLKM